MDRLASLQRWHARLDKTLFKDTDLIAFVRSEIEGLQAQRQVTNASGADRNDLFLAPSNAQ